MLEARQETLASAFTALSKLDVEETANVKIARPQTSNNRTAINSRQVLYTMTENAPPGSANNAGADGSRGVPYYERLRRDLRESLNKKRLIDNNLVSATEKTRHKPVAYLGV